MPIRVIEDSPKSLVVEFEGIDRSIADLIADRLLEKEGIEFAGVELEHPQIGKPRLVVKAEKNAKQQVIKVIEELEEELGELRKQMPKK